MLEILNSFTHPVEQTRRETEHEQYHAGHHADYDLLRLYQAFAV